LVIATVRTPPGLCKGEPVATKKGAHPKWKHRLVSLALDRPAAYIGEDGLCFPAGEHFPRGLNDP